jgi:hypothetical protein
MTIVSVSVEANGWVLAVRGLWAATPGAWEFDGLDRTNGRFLFGGLDQFPLTPDSVPKIIVALRDAGFDRIAGLPVANAGRPRTLVGTKALRLPHPEHRKLDEFDHGDGTRTVRIALSDRIYATSTVASVAFLPGWKDGQDGGAVATVTNGSTLAAPLPIFRWANEPWPLVQGTAGAPNHMGRVELIVASHHPDHHGGLLHQAVAAVRLTAFDGATSKAFHFAAPQTSPLYGDGLRCWGGEIDLSGLSPGGITVHAVVYPWVGEVRETGTGHSTSINAALASEWGAPFHLFYDPHGSVAPRKYVAVDPASPNSGVTDSAQLADVLLHDSAAAAEAAPLASKPATYSMALAKFGAVAPALAARNGFAGVNRCAAWWEILLPVGKSVHSNALGASTGANAGPGYLVVSAVPSAAAARSDVVFGTNGTQRTNGAVDRIKFRGIRVELSSGSFFGPRSNSWTSYEDCDVRSDASGGTGNAYFSEAFASMMQCDMRDRTMQPTGWFARNIVRTGGFSTSGVAAAINVRIATPRAGERAPDRTAGAFTSGTANGDDLMIWGCQVFAWQGLMLMARPGAFGGNSTMRRLALVNTLYEGAGPNQVILQVGETINTQLQGSVIEGVTLVGGRFNFHNDADRAATSGNPAFRVNGSPTSLITVGILAHGLSTGDTITTSGSSNANLNRADVVVTVLDANRFTYSAAAGVTTVPATLPAIGVSSGVRAGETLSIVRENLQQVGNVIRYSSFDRNATKHDVFNSASNLTGSWEVLYGVGFRGNVNANRGTASPQDFQYAFYGPGSEAETDIASNSITGPASYGVGWHGYVADRSNNGPLLSGATYNGDYRAQGAAMDAFTPSRLLGKGNGAAVVDQDGLGGLRGGRFAAGALGAVGSQTVVIGLQPEAAASPHLGARARLFWSGILEVAGTAHAQAAGSAGLTVAAGTAGRGFAGRMLRVPADGRRQVVAPD